MEAFFDGIREVLHGSGHAAVDGDRVADNVDADLDGINTESKYYYQPHEVDLFQVPYDGKLRVLDEAKRGWKNMGLTRGKGRLGKEKEKEGRRGSSLYRLNLVMRSQKLAVNLKQSFCLRGSRACSRRNQSVCSEL